MRQYEENFIVPLSSAQHCLPPPLVKNAVVVVLDPAVRTVTLACLPGHRFPAGPRTLSLDCNGDGTWANVEPCQGKGEVGVEILGNGSLRG